MHELPQPHFHVDLLLLVKTGISFTLQAGGSYVCILEVPPCPLFAKLSHTHAFHPCYQPAFPKAILKVIATTLSYSSLLECMSANTSGQDKRCKIKLLITFSLFAGESASSGLSHGATHWSLQRTS